MCVAKELQRNGLGYAIIEKSKEVAQEWGKTTFSALDMIFLYRSHMPFIFPYCKSSFSLLKKKTEDKRLVTEDKHFSNKA